MLLTPEELEQLTGYQKSSAQARWLTRERLPFVIGGDGKLKVLRLTIEQRLGASMVTVHQREPQLRLQGIGKRQEAPHCTRPTPTHKKPT